MTRGLVFDVRRYSVHDGPGIRTAVFLKGCPLGCWWCHNPESQGRAPFVHYDAARCIRCAACVEACPHGALAIGAMGVHRDRALCQDEGACVAACPAEAQRVVGEWYTPSQLLEEIEKDQLFFDESGGGATFSGGEPLLQWEFLLEVLEGCGAWGIHRTVDTTGFTSTEVLLRVAQRTDLFLYDIKTMNPILHREVTGVSLAPILQNLDVLLHSKARVRIRIPLVPGVTDGDGLESIAAWLSSRPDPEGIDLLPYHSAAEGKHRRFGLPWRMADASSIPAERVEELAARIEHHGYQVTIGG